jgi:hypothetical protein
VALNVALFVYMSVPGRALVGREGVFIDWRGGKRRYVHYADVADASLYWLTPSRSTRNSSAGRARMAHRE